MSCGGWKGCKEGREGGDGKGRREGEKRGEGDTVLFGCLLPSPGSYMFDEPSSYLDVKQRLRVARCIRDLLEHNK